MEREISKIWTVAYTKSRHEKSCAKELQLKGYEIYLPLIKKRRQWSDRKQWVALPLFKSYIFVKTSLNNTLSITQTPGITKIIKFGGSIAVVQNSSLMAIRLMLDGGYNPKITDSFIKGDNVVVREGSLKGIQGEVVRIDGNDRLIVRIDSIQHSLSIKIKRSLLKKISF